MMVSPETLYLCRGFTPALCYLEDVNVDTRPTGCRSNASVDVDDNVLCTVNHVPCTMYCIPCTMHLVLCYMYFTVTIENHFQRPGKMYFESVSYCTLERVVERVEVAAREVVATATAVVAVEACTCLEGPAKAPKSI